jgi:hypothetical protein
MSTKVPEGSCALGGVGCHLMAVMMGRNTVTISHMGGEGATWLGVAGHSGTQHVFANMGDGTYFHSGLLAIRAAVAAGRQHHLQTAVQRRRGDDRRPAGGRHADRAAAHAPARRRGCRAHHRDERRAGEVQGVTDFAPAVEIRHRDGSTKPSANCAKLQASPP